MATLKAHGGEIGIIEYIASRVAVCADGHILKDQGRGWKLYRIVKSPAQPEEVLKHRQDSLAKKLAEQPCLAALYRRLKEMSGGFEQRIRLYALLTLLSDDVDGFASEAQDQGLELSLEDAKLLCDDWRLAKMEAIEQQKNQMQKAAPAAQPTEAPEEESAKSVRV